MSRGRIIKGLRQSLYLNQTEFAKLLGISVAAVCLYEKEERVPRLHIVKKMRDLAKKNKIEISVNDFLN